MRGLSARAFAGKGWRTGARIRATVAAKLSLAFVASARADEALRGFDGPAAVPESLTAAEAAVFGMAVLFAALVAGTLFHLSARRAWMRRSADMEAELAGASARADRAALILRSDPQIVIAWERPDAEPSIEGDPGVVAQLVEQQRRDQEPRQHEEGVHAKEPRRQPAHPGVEAQDAEDGQGPDAIEGWQVAQRLADRRGIRIDVADPRSMLVGASDLTHERAPWGPAPRSLRSTRAKSDPAQPRGFMETSC